MNYIEPAVLIRNRTLRTERKRRGWSQARLAKAIGVATRTVIRWERGVALPHPSHRVRLETLFGRTSEELGLFWDTDEHRTDKLMQAAPGPLAQPDGQEALEQPSLLVDTAIQRALDTSESLLGRTRLLMQIKEALFNCLPFTALYGLPGVGKTSLAVAVAADEQVQAHFPDGILWAPLGPQPHVLGQLTRWATQLGITSSEVENPESLLAWERALRSAIGSRQMLLIIDDAWAAEDALALQVGGPRCAHLLTTRQSQVAFVFAQQHAIAVPQLEEGDGLALLARYVPQLIQQDPQSAQSLVQALGCLPLALNLMGKFLTSSASTQYPWPLQVILMQVHDLQDQLRLSMPIEPGQQFLNLAKMAPFSLYAAIAMCAKQLSREALATLCTLAIFPPKPHSFSEEAALVISQQPREMLDTLCAAGLLECWGSERYSLHQMVAHYARVRAKSQLYQE